MKKIFPILFFIFISGIFFAPFILNNKLPIPSDTIVGLYHPFRDFYRDNYPNGIPYKNSLITDPVRQQIPWRSLAIEISKNNKIPSWNPYSFSGTPHIANFQSAVFYPLNILFFIFPFQMAWSILILIQPILTGYFLYLYLKNLRLNSYASIMGGLVFSFSGFSIAWLEWGTIGHTALWLPLVLLSIDKVFANTIKTKISNFKFKILNKPILINKTIIWAALLLFSLSSSFFAGHLQTFFYLFSISVIYLLARWIQFGRQKKHITVFVISYLLFSIITLPQWLPTLEFIGHSARSIDQTWQSLGWFIPWQNLIQFAAPDFFGNPATLNYWGVWNYGEFIGYIGMLPLILALFALFYRNDRKTFFFGSMLFMSLIFSLPTVFAKIPFILSIPFISTAQPTRLMFLTSFSLAVLSAFGFDKLMKKYKSTHIMPSMLFVSVVIVLLWGFVMQGFQNLFQISDLDLMVSKRNLILPTIMIGASIFLLFLWHIFSKKKAAYVVLILIIVISMFDILRFGLKFTPFTDNEYFFPNTKAIEFLQRQKGITRSMSLDDRIMPPNFSVMYKLQTIEGYDPLYLRRYGELIAAAERGEPDISSPFGFNRIITPKNYESRLIDLMGVKYIMSLDDLKSDKLKKVFTEGQTIIYENTNAFDRAFFVKNISPVAGKKEAIRKLFDSKINLRETAIVEEWNSDSVRFASGSAIIAYYSESQIEIDVNVEDRAFMVLMDTYYPTWRVSVCDINLENCKKTNIYLTNYNFRGVIVPKGEHKILFRNYLL